MTAFFAQLTSQNVLFPRIVKNDLLDQFEQALKWVK